MNEDTLLQIIQRELPIDDPSVLVGSGDDCAVVKAPHQDQSLVLKTDATLEGVHFTKEANLEAIGWKAFCRPISDFAAMGAIPQHALVTVAAPISWGLDQWLELCHGMRKAARSFKITIIGGEITRSPEALFLSIALTGITGRRTLLRSGAKPNDLICVTGKLGGSLKSKRHLTFLPRLLEGQWLATQPAVHAMMDLSDGLGSDLPRLARASKSAFVLEQEKIPCHADCSIEEATSDGEDYELLMTIDPKAWLPFHADWQTNFPKLEITPIGRITPSNQPSTEIKKGFDHLMT